MAARCGPFPWRWGLASPEVPLRQGLHKAGRAWPKKAAQPLKCFGMALPGTRPAPIDDAALTRTESTRVQNIAARQPRLACRWDHRCSGPHLDGWHARLAGSSQLPCRRDLDLLGVAKLGSPLLNLPQTPVHSCSVHRLIHGLPDLRNGAAAVTLQSKVHTRKHTIRQRPHP